MNKCGQWGEVVDSAVEGGVVTLRSVSILAHNICVYVDSGRAQLAFRRGAVWDADPSEAIARAD